MIAGNSCGGVDGSERRNENSQANINLTDYTAEQILRKSRMTYGASGQSVTVFLRNSFLPCHD